MKKKPIYIAFGNQKGGVGKSTFTVLAASYFYYTLGYKVGIIDCDYPQHSITAMRERESGFINQDDRLKTMLINQFSQIKNETAYKIIASTPEEAMKTAEQLCETAELDLLFFDVPGTVNSSGIINLLANLDFIFTPIIADKQVMESSLSFASTMNKLLVKHDGFPLQGLYLFWNKVHATEKTDLYKFYKSTIEQELSLPLLQTGVPDTVRYKKELSLTQHSFFRSTFFPPDNRLLKESNLTELITEISEIIKLPKDGKE